MSRWSKVKDRLVKPPLMLVLILAGFVLEFLVEFPFRLTLWVSDRARGRGAIDSPGRFR